MNQHLHGYSFENSVLAFLNLEDRPVVDIPMPAVYGNERSSMRVSRIVVSFPPRLARMFLRRLLYKYVIYDTSPVTLYAVLGTLLSGFGTLFGAYHWWRSIQTGIPATAGTVVATPATLSDGLPAPAASNESGHRAIPTPARPKGRNRG